MFIPNLNYNSDDTDLSNDGSYGSDRIDSDIEAELYSTIHHEMTPTQPNNPEIEQKSLINLISVEENSNVMEKILDCNSSFCTNLGNKSNQHQVIENSDVSLKRKSNLITNLLDTIQVQNDSPRKKQKAVNRPDSTPSSPENITYEIIDSDSDSSVILSEPDESSVSRLQTNIETVYVSSDSEGSWETLDDSRMSFNVSINETDYSIGSNKDVWKINDADLYRTNRRSTGRYHENAVSQCNNCNRKGHVARYCSEPKVTKCYICGGKHMPSYCKNRMCTKCLRYGHDSRRCHFPVDDLLCSVCNVRGHGQKCCPDLWRRYHLTTSGGHIVKGRVVNQTRPVYCFNCGSRGHVGFHCNKARMSRSYPNWLSVVSYEHPGASQNQFHMNSNFSGPIPQLQHPIPVQNQVSSSFKIKRLKKFTRSQEKRFKKLNIQLKKNKGKQKVCCKQEPGVFSSEGLEQRHPRFRQEINFPRTPKVNTNSPQFQCIDEMPKITHKRRRPKKTSKKKKEMVLKKQMSNLKNYS